MKIEIDLEPRDIERISQRVVEDLKPWLVEIGHLIERQWPQQGPEAGPRPGRKTGEYWDKKTVGEYLGISHGTLSNWICNGEIPFPYSKMRRRVRFKRSDVIEWAESTTVKASYDERIPRRTRLPK